MEATAERKAFMLTREKADQLATEWLESWNSHDLDRIMQHYGDEIEFISPFVITLLNDPTGTVRGIEALRNYFSKGLAKYPELEFHLHKILVGLRSFTVYYESVNSLMAAEVMEVNDQDKIVRVLAHYAPK